MLMIDFPFVLVFLTLASGLIVLVDQLYFKKNRPPIVPGDASGEQAKLPLLIDYSRSLFPVFVIVLVLRSFIGQLFEVPSGSLEPTIRPGEFLLVTQYPYGIRFPVWRKVLIKTGDPKVGDIVVIHWPVNPQINFIKRVIGVPGDTINYINKQLYINGKLAPQKLITETKYGDTASQKWQVQEIEEDLQGVKHKIYICPATSTGCPGHTTQNFYNLVIPKDKYFMMGDNRDDSDDSRYWGLVDKKDLVGQAKYIVFSWNSNGTWIPFTKIRWDRVGTKIT